MNRSGIVLAVVVLNSVISLGSAALPVVLTAPAQPSPQPVGKALIWSASWTGGTTDPGPVEFKWSVVTPDGRTSTILDFSPDSTFTYMPLQDGVYTVTVSAKTATDTMSQAATSLPYVASSLVRFPDGPPVVTPTANPFVVIYSAPCVEGVLQLQFGPVGVATKTSTAQQLCSATHTVNFLVAGLISNTQYTVQHTNWVGWASTLGPVVSFTTGSLPPFDFRTRSGIRFYYSARTNSPVFIYCRSWNSIAGSI